MLAPGRRLSAAEDEDEDEDDEDGDPALGSLSMLLLPPGRVSPAVSTASSRTASSGGSPRKQASRSA